MRYPTSGSSGEMCRQLVLSWFRLHAATSPVAVQNAASAGVGLHRAASKSIYSVVTVRSHATKTYQYATAGRQFQGPVLRYPFIQLIKAEVTLAAANRRTVGERRVRGLRCQGTTVFSGVAPAAPRVYASACRRRVSTR